MGRFVFFFFLIFVTLWGAPLQADTVDRLYDLAAKDYRELYRDTPFRDQAENWIKTIQKFERIFEQHPKHRKAAPALYSIGNLYRSLFKWNHQDVFIDKSSLAFRTLVAQYPKNRLADDAQFRLAENYEDYKNDKNLAYLEYSKLVESFPQGDFAKLAKEKLSHLQPPPKEIALTPSLEKSLPPGDLTEPRFGGLSEEEFKNQKEEASVLKINYWSTSDWSRLVIDVKGEVRYKYQALRADAKLGKGRRMYLDLYNAVLPGEVKRRIAADDGLINQARIAQFNKSTVRVVLDLASLERIKVFNMRLPNQYKVVIDMMGANAVEGIKAEQSGPSEAAPPKSSTGKDLAQALISPENRPVKPEGVNNQELITLSKAFGLKVRRIILDPGHGGKDPGALAFGIKEKDLTLQVALALKRIISQEHPDVEVLMTRETDDFIALEERTAFANQKKGDLFISIHFNASESRRATGMETYYLNLTADADALALAAKENQTSIKSISDLQGILRDLMTNSKINESVDLANKVQTHMVQLASNSHQSNIRNLGVKQAPFVVLLGAHMPSILIEAGFITNPTESKLIKTPKYRRILAEGIYRGVRDYIQSTGS